MKLVTLIYHKILFEFRKHIEILKYSLGLYDKNLVVFDGGLGSQIMSYFQYSYLLEIGEKPKVNLQYFRELAVKSNNTTVLRPWALDRYGIDEQLLVQQNIVITKNHSKIPTNLIPRDGINYFKKYKNLDLRKKLPIDEKSIRQFCLKYNIKSEYYAIHLRRGDFLTAASLTVSDEEVLALVNRIFVNFLKAPIIIFSDSKIDDNWSQTFKGLGFDLIILCEPNNTDQFLTHDLMRNAKILVTSNSTFSLSASLLSRKDQITITPMNFYSGFRDEPVNRLINQLSNFSIIS